MAPKTDPNSAGRIQEEEERRRQQEEDDGYLAEQTRIATDKAYEGRLAKVLAESERLRQDNARIMAEHERIRTNGGDTKTDNPPHQPHNRSNS